ncbi:MAG: xanthine dehydrogenase family protein subunit M [Acidobacteriota bacterium]
MIIPEFEYYRPKSLKEMFKLISTLGPDTRLLAGGTDLIPELKERVKTASTIISLGDVQELKGIEAREKAEGRSRSRAKEPLEDRGSERKRKEGRRGELRIGALATLTELIESPVVPNEFSVIKEAALTLASPPIRSMATIGGNIVQAVPSADMPPILIALKSKVRLVSQKGVRIMALEEFFKGPRETTLMPGEILKEIVVPFPKPGTGSCYLKEGRRGILSLAVAGVAVSLRMHGQKCKEARIVLGAVAPTPLLVREAGEIMAGKKLDPESIDEAACVAARCCCPITDVRASEEYRRELVRVLTIRAINMAKESAAKTPMMRENYG